MRFCLCHQLNQSGECECYKLLNCVLCKTLILEECLALEDRERNGCFAINLRKFYSYEFTVKDTRGKDVNLGIYRGKVLLVVNVASKCGFADANYSQLTQLYTKYKESGLEILGFPCNQFLRKEPGTSQEAQEFACTRYKAEYPIFGKIRVNGADTTPVYKFLKAQKSGSMGSSRIKWNFTKFLVDEEGHVNQRYSPTTPPLAFENDIKKALRVA